MPRDCGERVGLHVLCDKHLFQLLSYNSELEGSGEISLASSVFILEAAARRCPFPSSSSGGELAWLDRSCSCVAVSSCFTDLGARVQGSFQFGLWLG